VDILCWWPPTLIDWNVTHWWLREGVYDMDIGHMLDMIYTVILYSRTVNCCIVMVYNGQSYTVFHWLRCTCTYFVLNVLHLLVLNNSCALRWPTSSFMITQIIHGSPSRMTHFAIFCLAPRLSVRPSVCVPCPPVQLSWRWSFMCLQLAE